MWRVLPSQLDRSRHRVRKRGKAKGSVSYGSSNTAHSWWDMSFRNDLSIYLADVADSVVAGAAAADSPVSSPLAIVIFGATGDLAREKLYPALYNLMTKGLIPFNSTVTA